MRDLVLTAALLLAAMSAATTAWADDYQSSPPRIEATPKDWGPWLGPYRAKVTAKMLEDFGEQYLYAPLNDTLPAPAAGEQRVVFIGDSITDKWDLGRFFPGKPYVNRGIGGQVTAQLVVRFHADVVNLHPAAVVILAGVNDPQGAFQMPTEAEIEMNYAAMAEMATANGIKPIFTAILPVNNYTDNARTVLEDRKPDELNRLNAWLAAYCALHHYGFIDYGPLLRDDRGLLKAGLTSDGIHPNDEAYSLMAPVAEQVIEATVGPNLP